jgi:uncharacterized membrane protein AbrB (regulator of aidB expression)
MGDWKVTTLELNIHIPIVVGAALLGMIFIDFMMSYLQGNDNPWRIAITSNQASFQIITLFGFSLLGYIFGNHIGSALPVSRPHEPFVIGGILALILSSISRGYVMLHFHKVNTANQK